MLLNDSICNKVVLNGIKWEKRSRMFFGQYIHNLDDRGRISLPKKIRSAVDSNEVILVKGFEPCIFGYEKRTWEEDSKKELSNPISSKSSRDLRRYLFSGASSEEIDKVGRVLLPVVLKEYAKIKNNVVIIGAGDHFEMWDEKIWEEYLAKIENNNE